MSAPQTVDCTHESNPAVLLPPELVLPTLTPDTDISVVTNPNITDVQYSVGSDRPSISVSEQLSLAESFLEAYWHEGQPDALERAITSFRSAMCDALEGTEEKIKALIGVTDSLRIKAEYESASDEERAELCLLAESAVSTAACFPALHLDARRALGEVLLDRTRTDPKHVERAIEMFRELVDLTSDSGPEIRVRFLALYAQSLSSMWFHSGDSNLLDLANSTVDCAMRICTDNIVAHDYDLDYAFCTARWARSTISGNLNDLQQAIDSWKQVISRCPSASPYLGKVWGNLGILYARKVTLVGDVATSEEEQPLHAFAESRKRAKPHQAVWFSSNTNYAGALLKRYSAKINLDDLTEATAILRSVVTRVAASGYTQSSRFSYSCVATLSECLTSGYAQFGNIEALDEAVSLQLDAIDHAPQSVRKGLQSSLSRAYFTRFAAHGRIADLQSAITLQEQNLLVRGTFRTFPYGCIQLAESLLARFDLQGRHDDIDKAVSVLRAATDDPDHQEYKGIIHSLLGYALLKRGTTEENIADVEESIRFQFEALEVLLEANHELFECYHRLGMAEYRMFLITRDASALERSIIAYGHASSALRADHPIRSAYLCDLAAAQLAAGTQPSEYLEGILRTLAEAAMHSQSWPANRYSAAALWARTAHQASRFEMALDAYRLAISLLPQVAWLGLEDELRLQRLSQQPPDISQDAAACAIELGLYDLAVEIVDRSRGILWNTGQELRAELGRLREVAPELARELTHTNAALSFRPGGTDDIEHSERRRIHRLATRQTELIELARAIPGFQHFLLPPSYATLRHASQEGPVIILISSRYRCDALIVQANKEAMLVPLLNVTHRIAMAHAEALQRALRLTRDRKGRQFLDMILLKVLRDLWDRIGKPVSLYLAQQLHPSTSNLRRIWWCPTGAIALLPVHACGPYNGVDPNMPDLFVSSYTPTLATLLRSRQKDDGSGPSSRPRMLVVCQPETLHHPPLPCALQEARILFSLIPSLCTFRIGQEGTVARIQEMLRDHNWLHISTHGTQDSQRPLESSIALYDGDLKLSDLAQERMPNADFAFLSACHSARVTQSLPDEAMHLAAGFMFAGFKRVVATSWGIADKDAPVVAKAFYGHLIRKGQTPDVTKTAEALHVAVRHLRESGVPLHRWVPFIHLGA